MKWHMRIEWALWRLGLHRLSYRIHRKNEPLFYFQKDRSV